MGWLLGLCYRCYHAFNSCLQYGVLTVSSYSSTLSLVFMFALVLLPVLWHGCSCLVEQHSSVFGLRLIDFGSLTTGINVSKSCVNYKQNLMLKIRDYQVRDIELTCVYSTYQRLVFCELLRNRSCRVTDRQIHTHILTNYRMSLGLLPSRHNNE